MSTHRRYLAALVFLAGCATDSVREQPMTAAEMPVQVSLAGLSGPADFRHFRNDREGTEVRLMRLSASDRFAVVGYLTTVGDYVMTRRSVRSWLGILLPAEAVASATWHDGGTLGDGGAPTEWQAFDLSDGARCLGLTRSLRQHYEAAGRQEAAQAMLVSLYCREGAAPLDEAAAREVAAGLRVTG